MLAGFTLQEVGGPPIDERPDATGLFSDGRFLDFSDSKNRLGPGRKFPEPRAEPAPLDVGDRRRRARLRGGHDRRVLRAGLRSDRASHRCRSWPPAPPAAISARRSSSATASSMPSKLPALANDCLHMVVNNDPGLKAFLASERSARGEGAAVSGAADALALRRLSAGQRDADRHAQRRLRARPAGAGARQHQGPAGVRVAHRRERRLPAQLRADDVGRSRERRRS